MATPIEIGRLLARIDGEDKDFKAKMRGADQTAKKTAGSIKSTFQNLKLSMPSIGGALGAANVAGGNVLTSILGKVANVMTGGVTAGIDYNKTLEASAVAFETLGMSAAATQKHIAELQALALKTPFNFQDIVKASLTMNAFGFSIQTRVQDLKALSDAAAIAAAGTGNFQEALNGVIFAIGQMRAKGKVSAEEMNQLAERGIPAWDILSKKVGKTKEELMKLAEQGKLKGDIAATLLTEGLGQFASGAGDRLSKTILGKESNVQDAFQQRAGKDAKALTEAYGRSLDAAFDEISKGTGQSFTQKVGDSLADSLELITQTITGKISGGEFLGALKMAGADMWKAVQEGFVGAISSAGGSAVEAVKQWAGGLVGSAKQALGIQSPSTVFKAIGEDTVEGFNLGLESGRKAQTKSLIDPEKVRQKLVEDLRKLRSDPEIQAMLDTIASAEGANYNTLFGGGTFSDFGAHPNQRITRKFKGGSKSITSTAAGRYQFLKGTWDEVAAKLGLTNFDPESQDLAAIFQMRKRGMIGPTQRGDVATAFTMGNREWASLPGSPYGQPTKKTEALMETYNAALEKLTGTTVNATQTMQVLAQVPVRAPGMISGGEVVSQIIGKADLVPLAEIPKDFARLSMETTKARAALNPLPLPLRDIAQTAPQAASGMEAVSKATKDQLDALLGGGGAERLKDFKQKLGQGFDDLIGALVTGSDRWQDVAKNVAVDFFNTLASEMMLAATGGKYGSLGGLLGGVVGGLFGGFFGFGGKKAGGGSATAGTSYLIGEEGPELFTPGRSGWITPANQTRQMMSGQQIQVVNNFQITAPGGRVMPETQQQIAAKAGQGIQAALARNG